MEHLSNFEEYIHYNEEDRLVQLAIIHAQFELIHPFIDGNGRLGRILIPLFLYEKKLLSSPMFYISAYLEANRDEYYGKLQAISEEDGWNDWTNFFLTALIEQAEVNNEKARAIISLYNKMKTEIPKLTRSQYSIHAIDTLFDLVIFTTQYFIKKSGIPKASAIRILNKLKNRKILITFREGKGRKASVVMFKELIDIVEK